MWIATIDEVAEHIAARKERAGGAAKESAQAEKDRQALLENWKEKKKLSRPYRQRDRAVATTARRASGLSSSNDEASDDSSIVSSLEEDEAEIEAPQEQARASPSSTQELPSPHLSSTEESSPSTSLRARSTSRKRCATTVLPSDEGSE